MFSFESQGAVEVLAPQVPLNHENAEHLTNAFSAKKFVGQPLVVIDLKEVPLLDSAGLEALLDIQHRLNESAGLLKLANLSQLCEDIFRVTGLAERIETYSDTKEAVRSFVK